jgi:hypothetical protein
MAKRIFGAVNYTPTATSDGANLANNTYQAIRGATATQKIDLLEVLISGLGTSSAPAILQLARTTAVGSTTSALVAPNSDGPADFATAVLVSPPLTYTLAVGGPTRSGATTDAKLNLGINTFGGIIRWNAAPTQQWTQVGNTASGGESVLSAGTGLAPGAASSHIIYEVY